MALEGLSGFLEKFSRLLSSEVAQRDIVQEVLKDHLGILVEKNNITIKNNVVTVVGSPLFKQRLFMLKTKILAELSEKVPKAYIQDIR